MWLLAIVKFVHTWGSVRLEIKICSNNAMEIIEILSVSSDGQGRVGRGNLTTVTRNSNQKQ